MNSYSFLLLCLARCQHAAAMAAALLVCAWPVAVRADETAPLFGGTSLSIQGGAYDWQSATEDGTYHVDTYTGNGATVTVTGLSSSSALATVSGNGLNGYLQNGAYGELVQSGSMGVALNLSDRSYNLATATTTYAVDLANGQLNSSTTTTFSGAGGSFTVAANGDITGAEFGYVVNGSWLLNSTFSSAASLTLNGHEYTTYASATTYAKDADGAVVGSTVQTYSGSQGSFTVAANGDITGSEFGYVVNGSWYVNGTTVGPAGLTLPNGHAYTTSASATTYAKDADGAVVGSTVQTYSSASGTLTVAANGVLSGAETGYFHNGSWYVNGPVSSAIDLTLPNGHGYTTYTATLSYALDGNGAPVATTTTTYSGGSGSFTVGAGGGISGSESGCYRNGNWYLNSGGTTGGSYTAPNGQVYTQRTASTTYALDASGTAVATTTPETYSGGGRSFTIDANGVISGDESGYYRNGNWYVNSSINTTSPSSGHASLSLFGTTYSFIAGSSANDFDGSGNSSSSGWSDEYRSADGGNAQVWQTAGAGGAVTGQGTSGWDVYVGSFSADSSGNLTWEARTGPSFKPAQLWANGALLNWQSGAVDSSGTITDSYAGSTAQGAVTLSLSGQRRDYQVNAATAGVLINGASVGTLSLSGGFSLSGWDIQASDPNRTAPLFSSATLWVNGSEYPFSGGYEDAAGSRTDRYVTTGGTLTISGSTASPTTGTVQVSWNSTAYTGSFVSGGFTVGDAVSISTLPPDSGPPALWAAGRFYTRQPNLNRYECVVTSAGAPPATYYLNLSGADATHYTLNGTGLSGTLAGTFDASAGGVFLLTQNGSVLVPACPANEGGSLRLSAEALPQEFPPAVMVTNAGVWQFIGTLTEGAATCACYGNATAAHSSAASDGAGCLLRIDASGNVTLTNYLTTTTASGTYNTQSHLFQTGASSSLPMPIYGVAGLGENHMPWGLASPPDGTTPASFLVGNDVWHYTGTVGTNALYAGYYASSAGSQQLSLGTAGAGGGHLITVTDPVFGRSSSGMLNDVRGGTRLNNGTMVYSGLMNGVRLQSTINDHGLAALTGNLDIPGNLLSLGSLSGDAAAAGLTLQFSDTGSTAMLSTTLGRSAAQWVWRRMNPIESAEPLPVMALDSAWGLALYDPASPTTAAISLNPATGTITLSGSPVLTQNSGDARYVQSSQIGGSNSTILTQDNADDRYLQKDQPLRVPQVGNLLMGDYTNGSMP